MVADTGHGGEEAYIAFQGKDLSRPKLVEICDLILQQSTSPQESLLQPYRETHLLRPYVVIVKTSLSHESLATATTATSSRPHGCGDWS